MNVEIKYKENLYTEDSKGNLKVVKKGVIFTNLVSIDDITVIAEKWTKRGTRDSKRCVIIHKDLGRKVLEMPYKELVHYKEFKPIVVKGFRR